MFMKRCDESAQPGTAARGAKAKTIPTGTRGPSASRRVPMLLRGSAWLGACVLTVVFGAAACAGVEAHPDDTQSIDATVRTACGLTDGGSAEEAAETTPACMLSA